MPPSTSHYTLELIRESIETLNTQIADVNAVANFDHRDEHGNVTETLATVSATLTETVESLTTVLEALESNNQIFEDFLQEINAIPLPLPLIGSPQSQPIPGLTQRPELPELSSVGHMRINQRATEMFNHASEQEKRAIVGAMGLELRRLLDQMGVRPLIYHFRVRAEQEWFREEMGID